MKNHFSLRRFGLLFRKHTSEHLKTYLMSLVVLIGALFVVMGWIAFMEQRPIEAEQQKVFYAFFLVGAGTIFTSTVFVNLGDKNRAIATLMLPASQFEKYLVGWLYSFVLFLVVFTASFYLVDSVILSLDPQPGELVNIFRDKNLAVTILVIYGALHGLSLWGAIAFEKLSFIKTAFGFFILMLVLIVLNNTALEWMFDRDLNSTVPFGRISFFDKEKFYSVQLLEKQENLIGLFPVAMALFLWLAAFVRLKEKQI